MRLPASSARLGVVVVLLAMWEAGAHWFADPLFVAPPSLAVAQLWEFALDERIRQAFAVTFWELAVAFVVSVGIGVSAGLIVGLHRFSHRSVFPIILMMYATPQVAVLPLIVLYFGIGPASKIAFGVTHGVFPIIVTVVAGVQNIKPILLASAYSMGASRWQVLRWVVFPHMVPTLFTGMRLGMTAVLLGVLLAELYVSSAGIGYYTRTFTENFKPDKLFAMTGVLAAMAIFLNEVGRRLEVRFGRWRSD